MDFLIHNITIFTNDDRNTILRDHAVVVQETQIVDVGPEAVLKEKYASFKKLNGKGRLLMPGLINTHMHFYGTYARGLALPGAPQNFHEILQLLWWNLDSALDSDGVYYSTLIPAITAVKKGVTAVIDHHASPNAVDGSLDRIEEALQKVGMRGILCYEISDRDGKEIARHGLRENERYAKKCIAARRNDADHLFDAMIGLHASFTLDNDTLESAAALSKSLKKGCHIHVLEDGCDAEFTKRKYIYSVVERLQQFEILGKESIAAHCIHVDEEEKDILAETDTIVVHNPQSNMNNAVGRADIFSLLQRDILLGIGTDGMSPGLWPDVRTANLLHKHDLKNSNVGWQEIQQITLKNNPEIYWRLSGQLVGKVKPTYLADLILIDYFLPTPMTPDNFWGHFLFGIADAPVDTTIINGNIIMQNKQVLGINEAKIAAESQKVAQGVWRRFHS